ncbi:hypothetical protein [Brevibacterium album]|uniref:hypothetical protein n=1 Tax=Brevibacterium album TaxID=417948 RepID=UPI00040A6019|nr:hypothetical protein [Brevibacterium album]
MVLIVELGATLGAITGEPFSPVEEWGRTAPTDAIAFAVVVLGCAALAFFRRFPPTVAVIATVSYVIFAVRDYELGMFLPPMVVIFALAALTGHRFAAVLCASASFAAAIAWVAHRTAAITEPGVELLAWVAFGTVLAVFFFAPLLIGEIVRARSLLRDARTAHGTPG